MKHLISKLSLLCVCLAVVLGAPAVRAQAVYLADQSETITVASPDGNQTVTVILPRRAIQPTQMAVIVNSQDPQSVAVADYYRQARNIPAENRIEVSFPPGRTSIDEQEFSSLKAEVGAAADALSDIQALVITWTEPWKVTGVASSNGMSITSAFALGFSPDYYNDGSLVCEATLATPYFNTDSVRPYSDFGLRPAMMLAGVNAQHVIELIDRGLSADQTFPTGDGYFFRTTDSTRSIPRYGAFINTVDAFNRPDALVLNYIDNSAGDATSGNYLSNTPDILFYFTGLATVPDIDTNSYAAGAVADHLTSFGGVLTGANGQMSVLRWLEAGAVASYGTVIEPCNFPDKFTQTLNFVSSYFGGATVLEAYWKAVRTPGEGVFVGDPLARPYGTRVTLGDDGAMEILTTILQPGKSYTLWGAASLEGPFTIVQSNIGVDQLKFSTLAQTVDNPVYILTEDLADNIKPNTPLLFLPETGKTDVSLTPELQVYGLGGTDGDIHSETHWQIGTRADDFSAALLVLDVTTDSQLTSFQVPDLMLDIDTTYYWRVKFQYESGAQSEWSDPFSFTTIASDGTDLNLNGIPDSQEVDDLNLDLDADGTPDITQADMKVVKSGLDNTAIVVQTGNAAATIEALNWIDPAAIADVQNRPDNLPIGLINFKMTVDTPGAVADVIIYFSQPAPDGAQWYQYTPLTGWQDYSAHAIFNPDGTSVTLTFMDGGFGDADGTANGIIADPSGMVEPAISGDTDPVDPDSPPVNTPGDSVPTDPDSPPADIPGDSVPTDPDSPPAGTPGDSAPIDPDSPPADTPGDSVPTDPDSPPADTPGDSVPADPDSPPADTPGDSVPTDPDSPPADTPGDSVPTDPDSPPADTPGDSVPTDPDSPPADTPTDNIPTNSDPQTDVPVDDAPTDPDPQSNVTAPDSTSASSAGGGGGEAA